MDSVLLENLLMSCTNYWHKLFCCHKVGASNIAKLPKIPLFVGCLATTLNSGLLLDSQPSVPPLPSLPSPWSQPIYMKSECDSKQIAQMWSTHLPVIHRLTRGPGGFGSANEKHSELDKWQISIQSKFITNKINTETEIGFTFFNNTQKTQR